MKRPWSAFADKGNQAAIIGRKNEAPAHHKHWQRKRTWQALARKYLAIRG
jgi:hypothetical protein